MRFLRAFGAFWYDFLVGDRPEIFVGSIAVLAVVYLAIRAGLDPQFAGIALAALVLLLAGFSVWLAVRRKRA